MDFSKGFYVGESKREGHKGILGESQKSRGESTEGFFSSFFF